MEKSRIHSGGWIVAAPLFVVAGALFLLSGCLYTRMEPPRQLESGELVVSGSLDVSGAAFIPRVQGAVFRGLGPGDISLHTGFNPTMFVNLGVGGRLYLSSYLNLSLQLDGGLNLIELAEDDLYGWVVATPRLTSVTTEDRRYYFGAQANFLNTFQMSSTQDLAVLPAFILGLDVPARWNRGIMRHFDAVQVELTAVPVVIDGFSGPPQLSFSSDDVFLDGLPAFFFSQLSVGTRWSNRGRGGRESIEPSEEIREFPDAGERPGDEAPRRDDEREEESEEQRPEPAYDEHGVPVY